MPEADIYESFIPLLLSMEGCATQEEMNGNVLETLKRGYKGIQRLDRAGVILCLSKSRKRLCSAFQFEQAGGGSGSWRTPR